MGKKKGNSSQEKKEAKKQRAEKKQLKAAKKRAGKEANDAGEEDIEAILAEIMKKEAEKTAVSVEVSSQPSPRANFTLSTTSSGDVILFGGEYFDGESNQCYNDIYRWSPEKNEWKLITSPNSPPPRCSHQAAVYRDHMYIFGGEFATSDQFYHYRDMWRFDLKTNAWECIEVKGGPSSRSGHRMVVWRNYLVIFGGFYEAFRDTKWYNDLFLFCIPEMKWKKIEIPVFKNSPDARSACQLAVHPSQDMIFMYGGYAKIKKVGEKSEGKIFTDMWALNMGPVVKKQDPTWEKLSRKGHPPTPRSGSTLAVYKNKALLFGGVHDQEGHRHVIKSVFYNDLYSYDMDRRRWYHITLRGKMKAGKRRRKKKKSDAEVEDEDGAESLSDSDSIGEKEEENRSNQFGYVDAEGNIVYVDGGENEEDFEMQHPNSSPFDEEEKVNESVTIVDQETTQYSDSSPFNEEEKTEDPPQVEQSKNDSNLRNLELLRMAQQLESDNVHAKAKFTPEEQNILIDAKDSTYPRPLPRINSGLLVRGNTLYVYGGILEEGDRQITLDDCWSLDLKHLDEWKELLGGSMETQIWKGEASDTEDSSIASDDDIDTDEEIEEVDEETERVRQTEKAVARAVEVLSINDQASYDNSSGMKKKKHLRDRRSIREEYERLQEELQLHDCNRTPQVGENLRDFFSRTTAYWAHEVALQSDNSDEPMTMKDLKREGFLLAERRYAELLPVLEKLNALELEQKAAEDEHARSKGKLRGGNAKHRH